MKIENSEHRIRTRINEPVPPEAIHEKDGLSYMAIEIAIDRMNHLIGNFEWSSKFVEKKLESVEEVEKRSGGTQWMAIASYTVSVHVHVREFGIDCEKVGTTAATSFHPQKGSAISNAYASAESEAMRRAFRQLGHAVGNHLYTNGMNVGRLPGRLTPQGSMSDSLRKFTEAIPKLTKETRGAFLTEMAEDPNLTTDEYIECIYRIKTGKK